MTTTTERNVESRPDYGNGCYVINHDDHISCLGFDVCAERLERYVTELVGRGALDEHYLENPPKFARGSLECYDAMQNAMDSLRKVCDAQDERAVADLTPQLIGLEGWRVEVVDMNDERRRFIVGRSTGWLPIHLEISRRNAHGGGGASREYKSVTKLEKIW